MDNNQDFLRNYKRLEALLEEKYNLDSGSNNSSSIIRYYHELRKSYSARDKQRAVKLDSCRTIRNMLSHEDVLDAITVSDEYIMFLSDEIKRIVNPITALQVAVKIDKAFTCSLDDEVRKVMEVMVKRGFSHVPVIDEQGYLIGVFSQKIVFHRLYAEGDIGSDEKAIIKTFEKYLPISAHISENYVFVSANETIDKITRVFEESRGQKNKIGLIFVTKEGKPAEKILGFITPYDLIYYH